MEGMPTRVQTQNTTNMYIICIAIIHSQAPACSPPPPSDHPPLFPHSQTPIHLSHSFTCLRQLGYTEVEGRRCSFVKKKVTISNFKLPVSQATPSKTEGTPSKKRSRPTRQSKSAGKPKRRRVMEPESDLEDSGKVYSFVFLCFHFIHFCLLQEALLFSKMTCIIF
jgi:hypothetical protein